MDERRLDIAEKVVYRVSYRCLTPSCFCTVMLRTYVFDYTAELYARYMHKSRH